MRSILDIAVDLITKEFVAEPLPTSPSKNPWGREQRRVSNKSVSYLEFRKWLQCLLEGSVFPISSRQTLSNALERIGKFGKGARLRPYQLAIPICIISVVLPNASHSNGAIYLCS
jgi:hypothetical protein